LEGLAEASNGLSYAQLREAYIIAGQRAFIAQREISLYDLRGTGIHMLASEKYWKKVVPH